MIKNRMGALIKSRIAPQVGSMPGLITPQAKLVNTAKRFGNANAANNQGTTFQIYDSLPLDGRTEYTFFENSGSKSFPLTNLEQSNGKLSVGDTMVIQRAQLVFVTFTNPVAPLGAVTAIATLNTNLQFQQGELSFLQGNSRLLKRLKMQTWVAQYNKSSQIDNFNVFEFDTDLTIQSLLEFNATLRLPAGVTVANSYAQLILEGNGGLYSAKANY